MTREEAEFRLPDPGIHLIFIMEQHSIPSACKVCHIIWFRKCATYSFICELKAELSAEYNEINFTVG